MLSLQEKKKAKRFESEEQKKFNHYFKSLSYSKQVLFQHYLLIEADISSDIFKNIRTGRTLLTKLHCNTIEVVIKNNPILFPNTLKF